MKIQNPKSQIPNPSDSSQHLKTSLARFRRKAPSAQAGQFEATVLSHLRAIEREVQQLQTLVLARVYAALEQYFSEEELRGLCFDLGLQYDDLPGRSRPNKITALIEYLDRRGRLSELIHQLHAQRPNVTIDQW